jgi:uncharacterized damage-inducible protein DinB
VEAKDVLADALGRVRETVRRVVGGLTAEQLLYRPGDDANSIAWTVWHLTRVQDHHLSDLAGRPQAWIADGWHARFDMPPDPLDTGTGHTSAQVAAFQTASPETLIGYHDAVNQRSLAYLATVTPADLEVVLDEPRFQPLPTVGVRLVSVANDGALHSGEAAYIRGLVLGMG